MLCAWQFATITELDELRKRMSFEQRTDFVVPSTALTFILLGSVIGALVLSLALLLMQLAQERARMEHEVRAAKARRLRYKEGRKRNQEVDLPACSKGCDFHLFLSQ